MKFLLQLLLILVAGTALSYGLLSWLHSGESGTPENLSRGEQAVLLAESRGCVACHSLDGRPSIGPTWLGSWGKLREFTDGSTAVVDEAYLHEAMLDPQARIVKGYEKVMLPSGFIAEERQLIIDLIRSMTEHPAN